MLARFSSCLLLALALLLAGCPSHPPKEKPDAQKPKATPKKPGIPDASTDVGFQSYLGRLRLAVKGRDRVMLSQMMSHDFGYRWDQGPPGETPFDYWDRTNAWPELDRLLLERFAPSEGYMVSPPAFVTDANYRGYRCGIRQENGAWRFAYFVTGEDILQ